MSAWSKIPAIHAEVSFQLVKVRTVLTNLHCKVITVSFGRPKQMMQQDVLDKRRKCREGWRTFIQETGVHTLLETNITSHFLNLIMLQLCLNLSKHHRCIVAKVNNSKLDLVGQTRTLAHRIDVLRESLGHHSQMPKGPVVSCGQLSVQLATAKGYPGYDLKIA